MHCNFNNKIILTGSIILFLIKSSFAQLSSNYLIGTLISYKTTTGDGSNKNYMGRYLDPRSDTLVFSIDNQLIIHDGYELKSDYFLNNEFLILGSRKFKIEIIDHSKFYIETTSNYPKPLSLEERYYFTRISETTTLKKDINKDSDTIDLENYWFGQWEKYNVGNSNGDTVLLNMESSLIPIDTIEFFPPNKLRILEYGIYHESVFVTATFFIGWDDKSFIFKIIDHDHFYLDEYNPNYPKSLVPRYYYRRLN